MKVFKENMKLIFENSGDFKSGTNLPAVRPQRQHQRVHRKFVDIDEQRRHERIDALPARAGGCYGNSKNPDSAHDLPLITSSSKPCPLAREPVPGTVRADRPGAWRVLALELDEQRFGARVADVLRRVRLRRAPFERAELPRLRRRARAVRHLELYGEVREVHDHAVLVVVQRGFLARRIRDAQDPDLVVLELDLVVVRRGLGRVVGERRGEVGL